MTSAYRVIWLAGALGSCFMLGTAQLPPSITGLALDGAPANPTEAKLNPPLAFEHSDSTPARYVARGHGYKIVLDDAKATIAITPPPKNPGSIVSMQFAGGRHVPPVAGPELPGKINYIRGNDPAKWEIGLPTYKCVSYQEIYRGVDVVFYGNQQQLEFDLLLKVGADPQSIRLKFDGARDISLSAKGDLILDTAAGQIRLPMPRIYQGTAPDAATRKSVAGHYKLHRPNEVGFEVAAYDATKPLIIDPTVEFAALFGASANARAIALDSMQNIYVAGQTYSADFPATAGTAQPGMNANGDGFVLKMNPTGTEVIYATYLGGALVDGLMGIAVDSVGAAWVTGFTDSSDFPKFNAYQSSFNGSAEAVVAKLSATGTLEFASYLGTSSFDYGYGIAVDSSGNAYVTGMTTGAFPTTPGVLLPSASGVHAFVTKFSSSASIVYSTLLGGDGTDYGFAIAADTHGNAYVTGQTSSSHFVGDPGGGARTTNSGDSDAFVAKLNAKGTTLVYFTFLGGSNFDQGNAIALDSSSPPNAYIGGKTQSSNLPTTKGVVGRHLAGGSDGFVAKLTGRGAAFSYVTYLGGNRTDFVAGLGVERSTGNVYVAGETTSSNFPNVSPVEPFPGNLATLFKSNLGTSWSSFDTNIPGVVRSILPDPVHSGTAVVSTDSGIYRTANNGATWTLQSFVNDLSLSRSPANPNTIFAMAGDSYLSTDNGVTWGGLISSGTPANVVVADPLSQNTAYAYSAYQSGMYKTINGGVTWTPLSGFPSGSVFALVAAPNGTLYAAVSPSGVYKSSDHGATWTAINAGLPNPLQATVGNTLSVSPGNADNVLYLSYANTNLVYKSTNGGTSWAATSAPIPNGVVSVMSSPNNPDLVYATSPFSPVLYLSSDGGASWTEAADGLGLANISGVVFNPLSSTGAYAVANVIVPAFVAKLNSTATSFVYSSYLGGGQDSLNTTGIATDGLGDAFVVGTSQGFPFASTLPVSPNASAGFVVAIKDATDPCAYSISPNSGIISSALQTVAFNVNAPSGCSWTAMSYQPWAAVTGGASGTGAGVVTVQAAANFTTMPRSASISVNTGTASLTQSSSSCSYQVSPFSSPFDGNGGSGQMSVFTADGCPWNVMNYNPAQIVDVTPSSGTGNGLVNFTVLPNLGLSSQTLALSVMGRYFVATESGCTVSINPASFPAVAAGGNASLGFTTSTPGCSWTASSNAVWLSITSGSSGIGNGTVGYSIATNTGPARSGTLTIDGQTLTVNQDAGAIFPVSVSPAAGVLVQTLTFTFSDPSGYADVAVVNVLINSSLSGIGACYVAFAPAGATSGYMYLVDDAGDGGYASGSPMSLPSSGTLQNSQCTISGAGSSVSASGNTLTLTLAITANSSFAGDKLIYMAARNNGTGNSGWQPLGAWNVPGFTPTGPSVGVVSPVQSNTTSQTYTINFNDTNGFADLAVVNVLINDSLNGIGACYVAFTPSSASTGYLYLVDDAGDGGYVNGSPIALPSTDTLQNSQCSISGAGSSVAGSFNSLALNLAITFTPGFSGNRVFYLAARDNGTGNSGWQPAGTVTVP